MKKLLAILMVALMLTAVLAPCALAADAAEGENTVQSGEAAPDNDGAAAEANEDSDGDAAEAPAPEEESSGFYNTRNLVIGGVSIGLMVIAFVVLRIKLHRN